MALTLNVVVATLGRPAVVARLVAALAGQTRPADRIYVVGASQADLAALAPSPTLAAMVGRPGSCSQRNDALDAGAAQADVVVFLDDDFAPSRYWFERVEAIFANRPEIAGVSGVVLRDGAKTAGIAPDEAWSLVAARDAAGGCDDRVDRDAEPYGCNMAVRGSSARDVRFDERLPSYGWLEDRDYAERARGAAGFGYAHALWGVHMGAKSGRTPGVRLGYSQIANAAYLVGKGTATRDFAVNLAGRNILANLAKSLNPEPWIDRRGRLRGNLLALADIARGKVRPERARDL
jgi:GT2 family glycosyltransferase